MKEILRFTVSIPRIDEVDVTKCIGKKTALESRKPGLSPLLYINSLDEPDIFSYPL